MSITFDPEADAAYIPVSRGPGTGEATQQISGIAGPAGGEIILDFNSEGRLLGVEVLGATRLLRAEDIEGATLPG